MSGVPDQHLATIWDLCTQGKDSLNETQFLIAMHLITCLTNGASLPDTLPNELIDSVTKMDNEVFTVPPNMQIPDIYILLNQPIPPIDRSTLKDIYGVSDVDLGPYDTQSEIHKVNMIPAEQMAQVGMACEEAVKKSMLLLQQHGALYNQIVEQGTIANQELASLEKVFVPLYENVQKHWQQCNWKEQRLLELGTQYQTLSKDQGNLAVLDAAPLLIKYQEEMEQMNDLKNEQKELETEAKHIRTQIDRLMKEIDHSFEKEGFAESKPNFAASSFPTSSSFTPISSTSTRLSRSSANNPTPGNKTDSGSGGFRRPTDASRKRKG